MESSLFSPLVLHSSPFALYSDLVNFLSSLLLPLTLYSYSSTSRSDLANFLSSSFLPSTLCFCSFVFHLSLFNSLFSFFLFFNSRSCLLTSWFGPLIVPSCSQLCVLSLFLFLFSSDLLLIVLFNIFSKAHNLSLGIALSLTFWLE